MKKIASWAAVWLLLTVCSVQAQFHGVTAELKLDQDQYMPGEDIKLKVRIMNRSGQEILLGGAGDWIVLSVVDEKNRSCPKLGEMPIEGEFSLQSGEVGTRTLNPTPYFDFRGAGRYWIMARIRIPQWKQEITCKSVHFSLFSGVALPNLENLQFGMPLAAGVTNAVPEMRKYSLLKVTFLKEMKLYFRLTDSTGRIVRVFPIARMMSFSEPEAQIDRYNNLHVLHQTGARLFSYAVINPDGDWVTRQTYTYNDTRPVLKIGADGKIYVAGGRRQETPDDLPAPAPDSH
jgi:hypothetical protein